MIHAVGINMEQNNQENNKLFFGKLEGSRNTKRGFWVCFSDKSKKRGKQCQAGRFGFSVTVFKRDFARIRFLGVDVDSVWVVINGRTRVEQLLV